MTKDDIIHIFLMFIIFFLSIAGKDHDADCTVTFDAKVKKGTIYN